MQETKTDLKLNALRLLILVSERSQTQVAESLGRTQSSISQQITALEREVGRKLFETKSHREVPTKAGEVLIAYARQIIALHDAAVWSLRSGLFHTDWLWLKVSPTYLPKQTQAQRAQR